MFNFFYDAKATVIGSKKYPKIKGTFWFREEKEGVLVTAKVYGLPTSSKNCNNRIFAVHIHQKGDCSGTITDPFANVGTHYNPDNCSHPMHAGDLEPLFEKLSAEVFRDVAIPGSITFFTEKTRLKNTFSSIFLVSIKEYSIPYKCNLLLYL